MLHQDSERCHRRRQVLRRGPACSHAPAAVSLYRTNDRTFTNKGSIAQLLDMTANKFSQKLMVLLELGYAKREGRNIILDLAEAEPEIVETEYCLE